MELNDVTFICANCGKQKTKSGKVYSWLAPILTIMFFYPWGVRLCEECAASLNMIGTILTMFALPIGIAILVWFFMQ